MTDEDRLRTRKGVLAMIGACVIWGLSPLYYRLLDAIPATDILAHRTIWSLVFFVGVLAVQGRVALVARAVTDRGQAGWILLAALMVSINWFLFIYAIQVDRVTETSLGYYILPLVSVVFGLVLFGERLERVQWLAVALAATGVVVLTIGLGAAPWISVVLATTFGIYGVLKKQVSTGPVVSVTAEVLLVAPLGVLWLAVYGRTGLPDAGTMALLMLSGPLTAGPLILFSYAAKRVRLATLGLIQYLNPSLQLFLAVAVFGEALTPAHAVAFPLIWLALAIYSVKAVRMERCARARAAPGPV